MNIYNYFISPDIGGHCERIGHVFNSFEMAVIVSLSKKTVKEKHTAYNEIIEEYPDMLIQNSKKHLHAFLRELMDWETEVMDEFYKKVDGEKHYLSFYTQKRLGTQRTPVTWENSTFDIMLKELRERNIPNISEMYIYKKFPDGSETSLVPDIDIDGNIIDFFILERDAYSPGLLSYAQVHIPVPFKKGDILSLEGTPVILGQSPNEKPEVMAYEGLFSQCGIKYYMTIPLTHQGSRE